MDRLKRVFPAQYRCNALGSIVLTADCGEEEPRIIRSLDASLALNDGEEKPLQPCRTEVRGHDWFFFSQVLRFQQTECVYNAQGSGPMIGSYEKLTRYGHSSDGIYWIGLKQLVEQQVAINRVWQVRSKSLQ